MNITHEQYGGNIVTIDWVGEAISCYVMGGHYNLRFSKVECLRYLHADGMTGKQHAMLKQARRNYTENKMRSSALLAELDRSLNVNEPQSARTETWSQLRATKDEARRITDNAERRYFAMQKETAQQLTFLEKSA